MGIGMIWLLFDPHARSVLDAANLVTMLVGCSMFHRLKAYQKVSVINIFQIFLAINFITCFLQFISADFQLFTSSFFTADYRPNVLQSVRARNGGVTGLGPEPAYCATLVVGLGMVVSAYRPKNLSVIFFVVASLLLLRSISGYFYGFIYLVFIVSQQPSIILYQFRKTLYFLVPITIAFFFINWSLFEWARLGQIFSRFIQFFVFFIESGSLLEAEGRFGSDRLLGVYLGFSKLSFTTYYTGFSPAAALNFLSGTALTSVIIGLAFIFKKGIRLRYLTCLIFVFICGPKLMWPIFYLGLFGTEHIKRVSVQINQLVRAKSAL